MVPSSKKKTRNSKSKKKKARVLNSEAELARAQLIGGIVDKIKEVNTVNTTSHNETEVIRENVDKILKVGRYIGKSFLCHFRRLATVDTAKFT